jgi:dienelactone hydrolase
VRPWWIVLAIAALTAGLIGYAWHYSNLIVGIAHPATLHEQRVLAAGGGRIRLSRDRESLQAGMWALQWPDGYGWVGHVVAADSGGVEREFRAVIGFPPVGGWASLRGFSRSADPRTMLGIDYDTVAVDGPLGRYPAWLVRGRDSTWVLYVHGRGTNRAEGLRALSVLRARGLPGLLVTYRNDVGAPPSPDRLYHLGLTEWEDVEGAARYALAHGARDLVLSGYSMGGQIIMQFMSRSSLAARVTAVELESPVLDWRSTLKFRAHVLRVPTLGTWLGMGAAAARARLDWEQLDRVVRTPVRGSPILVFHCVHDTYSPEATSEAFARALPGRVTLIRIEAGNHVEAWNADSTRYAASLHDWLSAHHIGKDPG